MKLGLLDFHISFRVNDVVYSRFPMHWIVEGCPCDGDLRIRINENAASKSWGWIVDEFWVFKDEFTSLDPDGSTFAHQSANNWQVKREIVINFCAVQLEVEFPGWVWVRNSTSMKINCMLIVFKILTISRRILLADIYHPQTKFAKVMFSQVSVFPRGVSPNFRQTPLGSRHPLPLGRQFPGADTPHPSSYPTREQTSPKQTPPEQTPPLQCMLGDTGNKQAVRILL